MGVGPERPRPGECTSRHYSFRVRALSLPRAWRLLCALVIAGVIAAGCSTANDIVAADGDAGATPTTESQVNETAAADEAISEQAVPTPTTVAPAQTTTSAAPATNLQADAADTSTTAAPTTTTTSTIAETTVPPTRTLAQCVADIPLDVQIGQLLFPIMTQDEFAVAESLATSGHLGGIVVLGAPNAEIGSDIASLQASSAVGSLIIAVDEEGGRVQRVDHLVGAQPSARSVAANDTPAAARQRAADHAVALGNLGFTMNLAPVVDLDTGVFVGDRSYGSDPAVVSEYALSVAEGILDGGLTPVIKHFPGHGAGIDSHTGLPTIPPVEVLRETDLVPFERAIARGGLPIMIGHLVVPGLTNDRPATLSPAAVDGLLRTELGFDGLVMTDALNMDAIAATTTNAEAAEQALGAGVDLIMLGSLNAVSGTVDHVMEAISSGRLSQDQITGSFLRVMDQRDIDLCSFPQDFLPAIGCETDSPACR